MGLEGCLPAREKGGERTFPGGLGSKKVDVSFSSPSSGLVLGISIKTINFPDERSGNFQKNLTNRRGDLIFESATLHRRFPFGVLGGILLLDERAKTDAKPPSRPISTFARAHQILRVFNRRTGSSDSDEKFELLAIATYQAKPSRYQLFEVGSPNRPISLNDFLVGLLQAVAERNPDDFVFVKGRLQRT